MPQDPAPIVGVDDFVPIAVLACDTRSHIVVC